jgi:cell division septum initiation protein DivIVA
MTDQTKEELKSENDELKAKVAELEAKVAEGGDVERSTFPNHHAPGYAPHERDDEGNPQP